MRWLLWVIRNYKGKYKSWGTRTPYKKKRNNSFGTTVSTYYKNSNNPTKHISSTTSNNISNITNRQVITYLWDLITMEWWINDVKHIVSLGKRGLGRVRENISLFFSDKGKEEKKKETEWNEWNGIEVRDFFVFHWLKRNIISEISLWLCIQFI